MAIYVTLVATIPPQLMVEDKNAHGDLGTRTVLPAYVESEAALSRGVMPTFIHLPKSERARW